MSSYRKNGVLKCDWAICLGECGRDKRCGLVAVIDRTGWGGEKESFSLHTIGTVLGIPQGLSGDERRRSCQLSLYAYTHIHTHTISQSQIINQLHAVHGEWHIKPAHCVCACVCVRGTVRGRWNWQQFVSQPETCHSSAMQGNRAKQALD